MAGAGWRQWTRERLSQTLLQTFLQDQVVMRFPSAAARAAALPTPSVGMVSYLDTSGVLEVYNGASWRQHSAIRPQYTAKSARGSGTDQYPSGSFAFLAGTTWVGAPGGVYLAVAQIAVQSTAAAAGTVRMVAGVNTWDLRGDVPAATAASYAYLEEFTHAGGDLAFSLAHNVNSGTTTVLNANTKMFVAYLGAQP